MEGVQVKNRGALTSRALNRATLARQLLLERKKVKPIVDEVFPLAQARAAHERLEAGEQFGKIVLRIPY